MTANLSLPTMCTETRIVFQPAVPHGVVHTHARLRSGHTQVLLPQCGHSAVRKVLRIQMPLPQWTTLWAQSTVVRKEPMV